MLGHASAAMTLDVYADLFDSDLESVAETVTKMWPRAIQVHTCSAPKVPSSSAYGSGGHIDVAFPPVLSVGGCNC